MAIVIKYIGPKPSKKFRGMTFIQDKPLKVNDELAMAALEHPTVFMQSDQAGTDDVDPEVLQLRASIADAYQAEGETHEENFQAVLAEAKQLPETDKAEKQKKKAWIEGAKSEIEHGKKLQRKGEELRAQAGKAAARRAEDKLLTEVPDTQGPGPRRGKAKPEPVEV